jgi:hypothetical protein
VGKYPQILKGTQEKTIDNLYIFNHYGLNHRKFIQFYLKFSMVLILRGYTRKNIENLYRLGSNDTKMSNLVT